MNNSERFALQENISWIRIVGKGNLGSSMRSFIIMTLVTKVNVVALAWPDPYFTRGIKIRY